MLIACEEASPMAIAQVQQYMHTVCVSPVELNAETVKKECPDLFIVFACNYEQLIEILSAHRTIFANPLSVLWCPNSMVVPKIDLQRGAALGINHTFVEDKISELTLSRIRGRIIANRQCKKLYTSGSLFGETTDYISRDEELMERILNYLGEHNHRNDFSIEKMGNDLGMSRTNFFSRIKSLTGKSPSRMVMNFRLEKAAHLLKSTDRNISEVAFEVGFSSTAYFTRCFKETFGTNPSKFVRERQKKTRVNH
ncbi:MAG: helix-turn-helix domain-containing protein [Fluviicola sp.]